jgi:60 kDa SS-A/Ro ribonucleoprotein
MANAEINTVRFYHAAVDNDDRESSSVSQPAQDELLTAGVRHFIEPYCHRVASPCSASEDEQDEVDTRAVRNADSHETALCIALAKLQSDASINATRNALSMGMSASNGSITSDLGTLASDSASCTCGSPVAPVFEASELVNLRRQLMLGCVGDSNESKYLSLHYCVRPLLIVAERGRKGECAELLGLICSIAKEGAAARTDGLVYSLATICYFESIVARRDAYTAVAMVCHTPALLYQFVFYHRKLAKEHKTGKHQGRGFRRAVKTWVLARSPSSLLFACSKYKTRFGFTFGDVLNIAHVTLKPKEDPTGAYNLVLCFFARGITKVEKVHTNDTALACYRLACALAEIDSIAAIRGVDGCDEILEIAQEFKLAREHLPTEMLNLPVTWEFLLKTMPFTGILKNLGKLSSLGLLKEGHAVCKNVCAQFRDVDALSAANLNPFSVIIALRQYSLGKGEISKLRWPVEPAVVAALNAAFLLTFGSIEPLGAGHRVLLCGDVSGSMDSDIQGSVLTSREAMCGVAAAVSGLLAEEPDLFMFDHTCRQVHIPKQATLFDMQSALEVNAYGSTNVALPILEATRLRIPATVFVTFTDNDHNTGSLTPAEALRLHNRTLGVNAKLVTVAFAGNAKTIAEPGNPNMLDLVGCDPSLVRKIRAFALGEVE